LSEIAVYYKQYISRVVKHVTELTKGIMYSSVQHVPKNSCLRGTNNLQLRSFSYKCVLFFHSKCSL